MAFQSAVNINQAFGVVGELIQDEPIRAETLLIGASGFTVGYAGCKSNSTNVATMGGTVGAGVLFAVAGAALLFLQLFPVIKGLDRTILDSRFGRPLVSVTEATLRAEWRGGAALGADRPA